MMTLLHIPGEIPPPVDVRLAVAMMSGVIAMVAVIAVIRIQSDGFVPAYVTAAMLWRRPPEQVSRSAADAVHLATGLGAGLLYETLLLGYERIRGPLGIDVEIVLAGVTTVAELLAVVLVVAALYGTFSHVVFPRYGGVTYETRPRAIRRRCLFLTALYGCTLFATVTLVYLLIPV